MSCMQACWLEIVNNLDEGDQNKNTSNSGFYSVFWEHVIIRTALVNIHGFH